MVVRSKHSDIRRQIEEKVEGIRQNQKEIPEVELNLTIDDDSTDDDVYIGEDGRKYYSEQWVLNLANSIIDSFLEPEERGEEWFQATEIEDKDLINR